MKYLKAFLLLLVCYLPMASCAAYRAGIGADFLCLGLFSAATAAVYIFCDNLALLVFYFFNLVMSASVTPTLLSRLYTDKVSGIYDLGTHILGDIFTVVTLAVTLIVAVILTILKCRRGNN